MREGWREVAVEDVARVVGGGTPRSNVPEFWGGQVQWLTPKDLSDRPARYTSVGSRTITEAGLKSSGAQVLPAGAVLLTSRAPVGYVSVASGPIATNQGFKSLILDDSQLPEFWYYLLLHSTDYLKAHSGGSTFQEMSGGVLKKLRFLVPPLPEQRRIVDLVATLDGVVAAASLAPARRAYDSVLAAMASQPGGLQLSDALRPGGVARVVEPDEEYRILGVLRSGEGFIERGQSRGRGTGYKKLFRVGADELVYRKLTAWEGPISVSTEAESGGWVSPEFPIFKIDDAVLLPGLMRHFCRWPGFWRKIEDRLVGSVQRRKRLNPDALLGIELPMPSLEVQASWLDALDSMWESVGARSATVSALQRTRAHLLAALMSGEHEIPESYDELMGVAS